MSCIFCKIVAGEIPCKKIYEDEDVLAFLDISQATYGHTLVVPKKHFDNLLSIEDYEYLRVLQVAKDLAPKIMKACHAEGCNIINNCNSIAGQTVMHFHVHILPRYQDDDLIIKHTEHECNLDDIQNTIIQEIEK